MPRLIWTPRALRDVERLHGFLLPKSSRAARKAISTIREGVETLGQYPRAGRQVESMSAEYREWPISFGTGAYLVLYRHEGDQVLIILVRHGREEGF